MKIMTILGARPQFIKAGSVSRQIQKTPEITEIIIHTGQHYDSNMSDVFFDEMKLQKPDYYLGIGNKSHGAMTGQMIEKIEEVALEEKPDWIMVYGDTNSTLAGAIVASKLHINLAHIEAGLRSFNMKMPEEINRILTDRVSQLLFCPTKVAQQHLKNEGFDNFDCKYLNSGDVMQEGSQFYSQFAVAPDCEVKEKYVLSTIHRPENTDNKENIMAIFDALEEIASIQQVILTLHPRTRKILEGLERKIENITIIDPVGYLEMLWLLDHSDMVITDSGGLQKEAFFFAKPCITLRNETEWVELVEHGFSILAGSSKDKILSVYNERKHFNTNYSHDLYGNGKASQRIIREILSY
jgi:UDP-GlcNAc3NAcA epimerase